MTNPLSRGESPARRTQEVIDEQGVQRLLESISKLKREEVHGASSEEEASEDQVAKRSVCYNVSVIALSAVFVALLFGSTVVLCGSLPYVNPRTRKVDAASESLEAEATLAMFVLMFLWLCFAFGLHLVCKWSHQKDRRVSRTEP